MAKTQSQLKAEKEAKKAELKAAKEAKKAELLKESLTFETTRLVSFIVNGEHFDGNKFTFESQGALEDAKRDLVASYGKDVILEKEEE